jgi:AcrR family transcriptional regulator
MPKVSEQHREARREQILDAAIACVARKGFHRTSMADIIAESGLSAGAIYLHFAGKEDIALAVGKRILSNRISEVDALLATGALPRPSEMLRLMMTGLTREVHDVRMLVQLWGEAVTSDNVSQMIGPIFVDVQGIMQPYLERWGRERLGQSAKAAAASSHDMVPVLFGLGQGYILQAALIPGFDGDRYFAGVAQLLDGENGA